METKIDGKKITLTLNAGRPGELSSTGKSILVETTHGYVTIKELSENGVAYRLQLNLIRVDAK